jgi:hypothetical protein
MLIIGAKSTPPPIAGNNPHLLLAPNLEDPSYLALAVTNHVLLIFRLTLPKKAISLLEFL